MHGTVRCQLLVKVYKNSREANESVLMEEQCQITNTSLLSNYAMLIRYPERLEFVAIVQPIEKHDLTPLLKTEAENISNEV